MTPTARMVYRLCLGLTLTLFVFTVASYLCNVCHVSSSGNSFYIGNGYVEYGYGWGWIRRRMFPVGAPDYSWTLRRTTTPLTNGADAHPSFRLSLWLCLLLIASVTAMLWKRGRQSQRSEFDYLATAAVSIPLGFITVPVLYSLIEYRWPERHHAAVSLAFAILTVLPTAVFVMILDKILSRFRNPTGHCEVCCYNLTGNVSGICPECGTRIPDSRPDRAVRA